MKPVKKHKDKFHPYVVLRTPITENSDRVVMVVFYDNEDAFKFIKGFMEDGLEPFYSLRIDRLKTQPSRPLKKGEIDSLELGVDFHNENDNDDGSDDENDPGLQ